MDDINGVMEDNKYEGKKSKFFVLFINYIFNCINTNIINDTIR